MGGLWGLSEMSAVLALALDHCRRLLLTATQLSWRWAIACLLQRFLLLPLLLLLPPLLLLALMVG